MPPQPIYLDYQATTPVDPRVIAAMQPYFSTNFGNPHAHSHEPGWIAEEGVETARRQIAGLIGARPAEISFVSGATEANNLAIQGVIGAAAPSRRHIVTTAIEHASVIETCRAVASDALTIVPVDRSGQVDPEAIAAAIRPDTALVSVIAVSNEIGVIQPLAAIGALCRARGVLFHTDAAQAGGRIALDVHEQSLDLVSLSAHKMYGPKGIGAIYIRRDPPVRLVSLMYGGGQERGLRPGTLPVPLCVGMGAAAEIARAEGPAEEARQIGLRDRLLDQLRRTSPDLLVNGGLDCRIGGNLNIAIPGVDAEALLAALPGLALATGSACASAIRAPSPILQAIACSDETALSSIRIGLGRPTTEPDLDEAAAQIASAVARMPRRQTAPC